MGARRLRILDGCCGAGGAARGYVLAGHVVWGTDLHPQKNYLRSGAAGFLRADILAVLREPWITNVDIIHVSPPCQFYSAMSHARPRLAERYPDLIGPVRELLNDTGRPWVIENVEAARDWMKDPVVLCAQMFRPGVLLYRHRLFEAGGGLVLEQPPIGREPRKRCGWPHPVPASRAGHWEPGTAISVAGHVGNVALARQVMEISWTTREELAEAVPPYYTEWIGRQLAGDGL
jgi:DNA (cytosine-5)-methyltransferase 1